MKAGDIVILKKAVTLPLFKHSVDPDTGINESTYSREVIAIIMWDQSSAWDNRIAIQACNAVGEVAPTHIPIELIKCVVGHTVLYGMHYIPPPGPPVAIIGTENMRMTWR